MLLLLLLSVTIFQLTHSLEFWFIILSFLVASYFEDKIIRHINKISLLFVCTMTKDHQYQNGHYTLLTKVGKVWELGAFPLSSFSYDIVAKRWRGIICKLFLLSIVLWFVVLCELSQDTFLSLILFVRPSLSNWCW